MLHRGGRHCPLSNGHQMGGRRMSSLNLLCVSHSFLSPYTAYIFFPTEFHFRGLQRGDSEEQATEDVHGSVQRKEAKQIKETIL